MREKVKRNALFTAILTGGMTAVAFGFEVYIGSPYGPPSLGGESIFVAPILFGLGAVFASFWVWPAALGCTLLAEILEQRIRIYGGWPAWILVGSLAGGPLMLVYSYPLGLGQDLLSLVILNGTICGLVCSGILRSLVGPYIIDGAFRPDDESSQDKV